MGSYESALEAAKVYDYYIVSKSLEHTKNGVLADGETALQATGVVRSDSSSGFTGVSKVKSKKEQWRAYANIKGKQVNIGRFDTPELAFEARTAYINKNKES